MTLINWLRCKVGLHVPHPDTDDRWAIMWICVECKQYVKGRLAR